MMPVYIIFYGKLGNCLSVTGKIPQILVNDVLPTFHAVLDHLHLT